MLNSSVYFTGLRVLAAVIIMEEAGMEIIISMITVIEEEGAFLSHLQAVTAEVAGEGVEGIEEEGEDSLGMDLVQITSSTGEDKITRSLSISASTRIRGKVDMGTQIATGEMALWIFLKSI